MDIIKKYRNLENEQVRAATLRYYGPFLRIGGLLPCIDEGWMVISMLHVACILIGGSTYSYLLVVTTYKLSDEFLLAGVSFHYSVLLMLAVLIFVFVTYKRETLCRLLFLTYQLYDYGDTDISEEEEKELQRVIKRQRLYLIPVIVLVGITAAFMVAIGPWVDTLVGAGETRTMVNGVYMKTPVPLQFPFEITSVMYYVAAGYQVFVTFLMIPVVGGIVLLYIVSCQILAREHRRLIISLHNIFNRGEITYKRMYGKRKMDLTNISDHDKFQRCITMCLKQNIQHHQRLREYFNNINDLAGFPLLLTFSVGSVIIALSLFTFLEKTKRIGLLMNAVISTLTEVSIMYTICFFGEEILALGEEVQQTVYDMNWYSWSKENKKLLMLMLETTQHPFVIQASLLFNCNMETFSSIINSAYSYYNMLSASSSARSSRNT